MTKHTILQRITASFLLAALLLQSAPAVMAGTVQNDNVISLTDKDGNVIESHTQDEWEELFPYGIFAFRETELSLQEGKTDGTATATLTIYRIGGTEGKAEATVSLVPASATIEDGRLSYANAMGTKDFTLMVEDPWPIAAYQPFGDMDAEIVYTGEPLTMETADESDYENLADGEEITPITLFAPEGADSYQWEMQTTLYNDVGSWRTVKGATNRDFQLSDDLLDRFLNDDRYSYDFRCKYVIDGVPYYSDSMQGIVYETGEDIPPVMPADFEDNRERTDSVVEFDGGEYDMYTIPVVFADGEWEKQLTFTAVDDDLHETFEMLAVMITDSRGATVNKSACTMTVSINDDEEILESAMGFAETEIWADKATGKVRIPLTRESEGLQYVTGVAYETIDGTATVGRDFAAGEGTALFASDLDYTYIELDLVNDGITVDKEDSQYFTLRLTEPMGGTLLDGQTEMTVWLYNTAEVSGGNLVSDLYSPDETDLTGVVTESDAIVPANATVTASQVVKEPDVVASYSLLDDGISTYTHTYEGNAALKFENAFGGGYWTAYAQLANEEYKGYIPAGWPAAQYSDDHEGFVANRTTLWGNVSTQGSTGIRFSTEQGGSRTLTIDNMYERYNYVRLGTESKSDESWAGDDYSIPQVSISGESWDDIIEPGNVGANTWGYYTYSSATTSTANTIRFRHAYYDTGIDNDANCQTILHKGFLERRVIKLPMLRIHTADDAFLEENAPLLHETIKPVVTLVRGKGGTTPAGDKLFNNSTMDVTRGNNASSYTFATTANGKLNKDSIFLSGEEENARFNKSTVNISGTGADAKGTLTLLMDVDDIKNGVQSYINVVMDRKQDFALEISPSVAKVESGDDPSVYQNNITEAWNKLWTKVEENNGGKITYTYREVNWDFSNGKDGFSEPKTGTLTKEQLKTIQTGGTLFSTANGLRNVTSINFHLNPEDRIVVGGYAYAGDEEIAIPVDQFLNDRINFLYYDEEYVSAITTMQALLNRVERYIDLNGDGIVAGHIEKGAFVADSTEKEYIDGKSEADNAGATYYVLPSLTEESYSINELAPRGPIFDENNNLIADKDQIVLKVYYTMVPRSLVIPEGASIEDKAEVIPAFVTSVTEPAVRNKMTAEQLSYRYINHHTTGNDKTMYTAAATTMSYVDIPMGGDFGIRYAGPNPKDKENGIVEWEPQWQGNPYPGTEFDDPDPIYLDGTLLGDRYPVGDVTKDGKLTTDGLDKVNNYLFSMQASDTFSLCVREEPGISTFDVGGTQPLTGIESATLSETSTTAGATSFGTLADPTADDPAKNKQAQMDSSEAGSAFPEYDMVGDLNLPAMDLGITDFVSIGIDGQEMSISVGMGLYTRASENNFKDQSTHNREGWEGNGPIESNRESVGKIKRFINSINPNNTIRGTKKSMGDAYRENKEELKEAKESRPLAPANKQNATNDKRTGTIASKGIEVAIGVEVGIILKWDPIESRFFFNQAYIALTVGLEASYTVRFTPMPVFFLCVKFSLEFQFALALEASRVKVVGFNADFGKNGTNADGKGMENRTAGWDYYGASTVGKQQHMGHDELDAPEGDDFWVGMPGDSFTFTTSQKAMDVHFTGSMYVEVVDDGGNYLEFSPGVITSAGDEAATIKLARSIDGSLFAQPCTLKFTVIENEGTRKADVNGEYRDLQEGATIVDRIVTISRQTHDVYFGSFSISPEMFLELSVGVDVVLFSFEIFANISVGCSFAFGVHDSPDYAGEEDTGYSGFEFNEFSAAFTLGFRVSAFLLFNYEFTGIQFMVTYDREVKYDEDTNKKTGWNYIWYGANQPMKQYSLVAEVNDPLAPTVVLPSMTERWETFNRPEDNLAAEVNPFAFDPSDKSVPFQYAGYGSSGDAFSLGDNIIPGSTYELVTTQGKNYIVYTRTRDNVMAGEDIHTAELVISEVQETALLDEDGQPVLDEVTGKPKAAYGLVKPGDANNAAENCLVLDDDTYGDLDYDVWADDNGDIHVAWVSYTQGATTAFIQNIADEDGNITSTSSAETMRALAPYTEVKTVKLDVEPTAVVKGTVETVSDPDKAGDHGLYYMPTGAGDMVFYAEAVYYEDNDLTSLLADYEGYYGVPDTLPSTQGDMFYGTGDPTATYQMSMKETRLKAYGKGFIPHYAVKSTDGTYTQTTATTDSWTNVNKDNAPIKSSVTLDNFSLTQVGGEYYAAFNTADVTIDSSSVSTEAGTTTQQDEQTIKKLYLQKLTVDDTTGKAQPESPVVLRKLVSYAKSNDKDGVYTAGTQTQYDDPYIANVNFLHGKLGELEGTEENFDEKLAVQTYDLDIQPETFLLFEMNGNSYVIPQASLQSITGNEAKGKIIPFFTRLTPAEINAEKEVIHEEDSLPTNVNIGVDGNGNIVAVYTRSENGVPGNAVYMTKYDPQYASYADTDTSPWCAGTRIAMLDMDTVEEAEAQRWSAEETALQYYDTNENGILDAKDTPQSFTFHRLRVGLAGEDKLLILAEGSLTQLEAVKRMEPVYNTESQNAEGKTVVKQGGIKEMKEVKDEEGNTIYDFNAKQTNGSYEITKGLYALSFGMGQQSLGEAAIYLSNYDLTPGGMMNTWLRFVNNGDVAIRASKANPATITLWSGTGNTGSDSRLAEWQVTENIRAGQEMITDIALVTLPNNLEEGHKIYFTVNEDTSYIPEVNAFSASTLTKAGEEDTPACITVVNQVELGYEEFLLTMVGTEIDDNGEEKVVLAPDIHVGNRGSKTSDQTWLHFQYEKVDKDGVTVIDNVDLTGHKLTVSNEKEISRFNEEKTLKNGYLLLRTMQDGVETTDLTKAGQIQSMHGRTVTGTFSVPKSYFDTDTGTGSLNLRVTIVSEDVSGKTNTEFDEENNLQFWSVEPKTIITTVKSIQMQKGSTLRLPVSMVTTTKTAPVVTVTELTDDQSRNLSVFYYDDNQKALVVMPGNVEEGKEGKIRIADMATNSIHDICYQIKGEGTAINIYDDNGIFTWYDKNGNSGETGHDAWDFREVMLWTETGTDTMPLNGDLSIANTGESFSFQTLAKEIKLYFMGADAGEPVTIEVSSNLAGYTPQRFTSADGETAVTIPFTDSSAISHTVTVTAVSDGVRFDRLEEYFAEDLNISSDPTAPGIYWSRTLPEAASLTSPITLTAYFTDMGGLYSVSLDGKDVTADVTKDGDQLWSLPITFTENSSHRLVVYDTAGNSTSRDLSVDWFSATTPTNPDTGAPDITASLIQSDGSPVPSLIPADMEIWLHVVDETGAAVQVDDISHYRYDNVEAPTSQSFNKLGVSYDPDTNGYSVNGGLYRVSKTDENGVTSYRFVNFANRDSNKPTVTLLVDENTMTMSYLVEKSPSASDEYSPIVSIKLNGVEELLGAGEKTYRTSGTIPVVYGGSYWIEATDEAGNITRCDADMVDIQVPVTLDEENIRIDKVTETTSTDEDGETVYTSNSDGTLTIDLADISGGVFDPNASDSDGQIKATYELALVPVTEEDENPQPTESDWQTDGTFTGLAEGDYLLYIRDANDLTNVLGPIPIAMELERVVIQDVLVTNASAKFAEDGAITVVATGGYAGLEYAIYQPDLLESGVLTIYPGDDATTDADDMLILTDKDGNYIDRPLWQRDNTLTGLPAGTYIVKVREIGSTAADRYTEITVTITVTEKDGDKWDEHLHWSMKQLRDMRFTIAAKASEGGTITKEGLTEYRLKQNARYEVTPDEGYYIQSLIVDGENKGTMSHYVFANINKDHTIEVVFAKMGE